MVLLRVRALNRLHLSNTPSDAARERFDTLQDTDCDRHDGLVALAAVRSAEEVLRGTRGHRELPGRSVPGEPVGGAQAARE